MLLCGCSTKQAASAIDLVQPGKETAWNHGAFILQVAKRDGNSLEGIRPVIKRSGEQDVIITADTGKIFPGSAENPADQNCLRIALYNPQDNLNAKPAIQLMYVLRK
jgi:hypothetical protein